MKQSRPSPAQLRVLRELAEGAMLFSNPASGAWLTGNAATRVNRTTLTVLRRRGWVTADIAWYSDTVNYLSPAGRKALEEAEG